MTDNHFSYKSSRDVAAVIRRLGARHVFIKRLTAPRRTGRWSGSTAPCRSNGPTATSSPATPNAPPHFSPGSRRTTLNDAIPRSAGFRRSAGCHQRDDRVRPKAAADVDEEVLPGGQVVAELAVERRNDRDRLVNRPAGELPWQGRRSVRRPRTLPHPAGAGAARTMRSTRDRGRLSARPARRGRRSSAAPGRDRQRREVDQLSMPGPSRPRRRSTPGCRAPTAKRPPPVHAGRVRHCPRAKCDVSAGCPRRQKAGSRSKGQVMQWEPPRPRPSSYPSMVITSMPARRSAVLVPTLRS
jgi:hypothetical protein